MKKLYEIVCVQYKDEKEQQRDAEFREKAGWKERSRVTFPIMVEWFRALDEAYEL